MTELLDMDKMIKELNDSFVILKENKGKIYEEYYLSCQILIQLNDFISSPVFKDYTTELKSLKLDDTYLYADGINEIMDDIIDDEITWDYTIPLLRPKYYIRKETNKCIIL